jgi:NTP pyrophosphatase (non-canonical NTP hydrolase)
MLYLNFPNTDIGAHEYGGVMYDSNTFCKIFPMGNNIEKDLLVINGFLESNGYSVIDAEKLKKAEDYSVEEYDVSLSPHGYQDEWVLFISRGAFALNQVDYLINLIEKNRQGEKFMALKEPMDLVQGLNEKLLEILTHLQSKNSEESSENVEKCLGAVFTYSLMLAKEYDLDVEEIVIKHIRS